MRAGSEHLRNDYVYKALYKSMFFLPYFIFRLYDI